MDQSEFFTELNNRAGNGIDSIVKTKDSFPASYDIHIKEDYSRSSLINTLNEILEELSEVPDAFDLWIYEYGEETATLYQVVDPYDSRPEGMSKDFDSPFIVNVADRRFTIYPQEDGTYKVFESGEFLALLMADIDINTDIVWTTADLLPMGLTQMIGEAIERYEE